MRCGYESSGLSLSINEEQRLSGHESEQTQGDSEGQSILACFSSWGCRAGHDLMTEQRRQRRKSCRAATGRKPEDGTLGEVSETQQDEHWTLAII